MQINQTLLTRHSVDQYYHRLLILPSPLSYSLTQLPLIQPNTALLLQSKYMSITYRLIVIVIVLCPYLWPTLHVGLLASTGGAVTGLGALGACTVGSTSTSHFFREC